MNRTYIKIGLIAVLMMSMSVPQALAADDGAKNIIILIGDRMGFAQVTAARVYEAGPDGDLNMDTLEYSGYMSTHSLNSLVTDSAAAGTALACGEKTDKPVQGFSAVLWGDGPGTV